MSVKTKALIAIFTAAILWASAGTVAKILFQTAPPFVAATHRFLLASCIILPLFLRERKPKGFVMKLLPLGLLNTGNVLFYFSGLALTTANTASILGTAVPLTTALCSWFIINERLSKEQIIGIVIGLIGALLIVVVPLLDRDSVMTGSVIGNLLLVGSLFCWTGYIVYARYVLRDGLYSPVLSTSINIFTVAAASATAAVITKQPIVSSAYLSPSYAGLLFYAAIGITIITFFLFQWGVQHVSAATASLKEYIQMVFGVGINAGLLGEHLTGAYIIGSVLVAMGVFIATGKKLRNYFANSS